jgi:hypothetical protein
MRHHFATFIASNTSPGVLVIRQKVAVAEAANADEKDNPARVPGTWVTGARNFGPLEVAGPKDGRRLTLRTLDHTGKELWRHEVTAAELGHKAA